jgi:hypothetical protein
VPLTCLDSFHVLTCLSICALQLVSAPYLLGFFLCPDLFIHLHSPGSECPLLTWILSVFDLSIHLCSSVGKCPHLLRFFPCPDLFIHLHSSESECPLLAQILSVLTCLSALFSGWVSLACSDSFHVLTHLSICTLQEVSAPYSFRFFSQPYLSICLCSSVGKCPSLTQILPMS